MVDFAVVVVMVGFVGQVILCLCNCSSSCVLYCYMVDVPVSFWHGGSSHYSA